jgi:peptide/nickel transport system permease protein
VSDWLSADAPRSRLQARAGQVARLAGRLGRERLAMAGLLVLLAMVAAAAAAPWLGLADPAAIDLPHRLQPPSAAHLLGTDELGRDLLARLVWGGRVTLGMVAAVTLAVAPLGLVVGCVAGYVGGLPDILLMRLTDIFLAFPRLILALAFVAALRPGIASAAIAIALTAWPPYARIARADTLTIRRADYIAAVRLTGATRRRIIFRHIMPLCAPNLIVRTTLDMSGIILTIAGLGFLGMGAQPPIPEWGAMIAAARSHILQHWWLVAIPGAAIFAASLAFNLLGDGLRDALDPRLA